MNPVVPIGAWAAAFLLTHFLPSHPPVRDALVQRLGRAGFLAAYSVVSFVTWGPLAWLWWTHRHAGTAWWVLRDPLSVHLAEVVAAVGSMLILAGIAQPTPTSVSSRATGRLEVRGAAHVTRHPMMIGIALVTAAHLPANGWTGDVVFLGSHLFLALAGAAHQDQRHAARPEYADYCRRTTFLPDPRGLPRIGGRAAVGAVVGLLLALAVRWAHRWF